MRDARTAMAAVAPTGNADIVPGTGPTGPAADEGMCHPALLDGASGGDPDILLARGQAAYQAGHFEDAVTYLRASLRRGEPSASTLMTLAAALLELGDVERARRCYLSLADQEPSSAAPFRALGDIAWTEGKLTDAVAYLWQATMREPECAAAFAELGDTLLLLGHVAAAHQMFSQAVEIDPETPDAAGRLSAIEAPGDPLAGRRELGLALHAAGVVDDAQDLLEEVLVEAPNDRDALSALGNLYRDGEHVDRAVAVYERALNRYPDDHELRVGLAAALGLAGRFAEGEAAVTDVLENHPDAAEAYKLRIKLLLELGRVEDALEAGEHVVSAAPDYADGWFARATVLLLSGCYRDGWAAYEWRRKLRNAPPALALAEWPGTPLEGEHLHVVGEQGAGDTVMFASCLPDLQSLDGAVTLHCERRLTTLMGRSFPWLDVNPALPDPKIDAGLAVQLGSLPRFLRNEETEFGTGAPYLRADDRMRARWREKFDTLGEGLKIGIAWRGGRGTTERRKRTIPLVDFGSLLETPGTCFIDLQYGPWEAERAALRNALGDVLHRPASLDAVKDLDDFAARVAALDLVISIDNTTVHFAGALGVPVWTLVPAAPSWRWQLDRTSTPWYGAMHLVRQGRDEPWSAVLERTKSALDRFIAGDDPWANHPPVMTTQVGEPARSRSTSAK